MSLLQKTDQSWSCTEGKLYKFSHTWTIKLICFKLEETMNSSTFTVDLGNDKSEWFLSMKINEKCKDDLELYLYLKSCEKPKLSVEFDIRMLNAKKELLMKRPLMVQKYEKSAGFGYPYFIEKKIVYAQASRSLPDSTLTIICEGSIATDFYNISGDNIFKSPECRLKEDLEVLLENENFSDVTFVVSDQEIKAHKNIIAARSPVFAAMFSHGMKEQKSNRVIILDVDHDVFKEMLHFIYTGQCPNLDRMAKGLLAAADKYQLERLKIMSENMLSTKISIDEAAEILVLADRHNANQLKIQTIEYIRKNYLNVMLTKGWKMLMADHMDLITRAFEKSCQISKS